MNCTLKDITWVVPAYKIYAVDEHGEVYAEPEIEEEFDQPSFYNCDACHDVFGSKWTDVQEHIKPEDI